eukprot:351669-Chlamydomonas_euryale.AAC.9
MCVEEGDMVGVSIVRSYRFPLQWRRVGVALRVLSSRLAEEMVRPADGRAWRARWCGRPWLASSPTQMCPSLRPPPHRHYQSIHRAFTQTLRTRSLRWPSKAALPKPLLPVKRIAKCADTQIIHVNLTSEDAVPVAEGAELSFTYSVNWVPTSTPFHRRFERYLDYNFFEHKVWGRTRAHTLAHGTAS